VDVTVAFEGDDPLLATHAAMAVSVEADGADIDVAALVAKADASSTVADSIRLSVAVELSVEPRWPAAWDARAQQTR
jgi:hypothetical protein